MNHCNMPTTYLGIGEASVIVRNGEHVPGQVLLNHAAIDAGDKTSK